MKNSLIALIVAIAIANPAFAATKKKKTTVKTATPAAETAAAPAPTHSESSHHDWTPSASFGLGSIGSNFHLGVLGKYETNATIQGTPITVGGRTGFILGVDTPSGWVIPLTATASYEIKNGGGLRPYIGVDMGIAIYHTNNITVAGFTVANSSNTSVKFAGLIVPGVHFTHQIYGELPFGTIAGGFTIFPSVGMHF
jgi:outer membrane protein W